MRGFSGGHAKFHDYLKNIADRNIADVRRGLIDLFQVLDTKPEDRDPYMEDELAAFPYVNGGLFANEEIEIPRFTKEIVYLLLQNASENFDWRDISPTIFGAVFESTLNPETRRSGGMHYTSIENIHKVIDPLFLDKLKEELEAIKGISVERTREKKLKQFQTKLSTLTFLDPACGSGNFLTETYISLRRIENEVLQLLTHGQIVFGNLGGYNPIQVSIGQFYGIEINDFAVTVAKTALWIAESQMMKETEDVVHMNLDFLPLKSYANIVEGNALKMDWETVVSKSHLSYIMGNPPFIGHQWRTKEQAADLAVVCKDIPKSGKLDYVCGWYNKAADFIQDTNITTAFVSTNSIVQGESVVILWPPLFKKGIEIQFAYRTFVWTSESKDSAAVHCVIVGISMKKHDAEKKLYENGRVKYVGHINGYLLEAPDVFIRSRGKMLSKGIPGITKGSQPTDGGNLILSKEERDALIKDYPAAKKFVRQYIGSYELINAKTRYCLWLKGVSPSEYRHIPFIMNRLEKVAESRRKSSTESVRRDADIPMLFTQIRQPQSKYLAMPKVSSERRRYIPIDFLEESVIGSDLIYMIPDASLYLFGVIISNVHMAWTRTVCGRLKSDYRYAPAIYNNFPWPEPTEQQKLRIEQTAQGILDARALYSDSSLADLYDELTMPPELRRAHQQNDKAVMQAYGFSIKNTTESSCVAALMKLYQQNE